MKTLPLFDVEVPEEKQEWGTFKDSLRAPIHNWFTYPAGFSYKAVESSLRTHHIHAGQTIYDPFMGSGTTNLVAKHSGRHSFGVEAHPFVFRITETKMNWAVDAAATQHALNDIEKNVREQRRTSGKTLDLEQIFPELVLKCYAPHTLRDLFFIRQAIQDGPFGAEVRNVLFVALTSILRQVSTAATGWPYIAPNKVKTSSIDKDAVQEFSRQVHRMLADIAQVASTAQPGYEHTTHRLFNADSRYTQDLIPTEQIDHVFTSPPYLNNFDYADRTRLELYFWGEAKSWGDISDNVRTRLITSATTQIAREDPRYILDEALQTACPGVFDFLTQATQQLSAVRLTKGGKKSYDHLVSGYFNDMFKVVSEVYRVLKPGGVAVFVLGDSAPYGVHIPTDDLIGRIGLGVGFANYKIDVLRERGGKWKDNPQRHGVLLRESIVNLKKA